MARALCRVFSDQRDELRHHIAAAGDRDFLAGLNPVDQFGQAVLGFEQGNFVHVRQQLLNCRFFCANASS